MSPSLLALLGFAAWTVALVAVLLVHRSAVVLSGRGKADSWTRGKEAPAPPFVVRAGHAHANCLETLPVFGAIVLVAAASGHLPLVDGLAPWVLAARLAQSSVHLIGVNHVLVLGRFTFFFAQVGLLVAMMIRLLAAS